MAPSADFNDIIYNFVYNFYGFNKEIFIYVNHVTNTGSLPNLLKMISSFFSITAFPIYYFAAGIHFYIKLKRSPHQAPKFLPIFNQFVKAGLCYTLLGFIYAALKFGINIKRPFCSLIPSEFITILDVTSERCPSSFPSAHTGLAVIIAWYIWPWLGPHKRLWMIFLVFAVAISRITMAMHYPADILYSILIVFILIFLTSRLFKLLHNKIIAPVGRLISSHLFSR